LLFIYYFQANIHSPFKYCDTFSYPDSNLEGKLIDININQQVEFKDPPKAVNIPSELEKGVEPFIGIKQRFFNQKPPNKKQRKVTFSYLGNLVGIRVVLIVKLKKLNRRRYQKKIILKYIWLFTMFFRIRRTNVQI
jgi:hypothetical protein